jgi:hypothetical protein
MRHLHETTVVITDASAQRPFAAASSLARHREEQSNHCYFVMAGLVPAIAIQNRRHCQNHRDARHGGRA